MNYLFVCAAVYDNSGYAMVKGAMNGISFLDPTASFGVLVLKKNYKDRKLYKSFRYESELTKAMNWADIMLNVGGLTTRIDVKRDKFLKGAKSRGIPHVWMSQSMEEDPVIGKRLTKKDLDGTLCVARGNNAADYIKNITGKSPVVVAADLSFLIESKKWEGKRYVRGYSTYHPKRARVIVKEMHSTCNEVSSIQIVWKKTREKIFEPELPIDRFAGTVEENFGLVESLQEMHTARYQGGTAAIYAGIVPHLIITSLKYEDLMSFSGWSKEALRKSALQSCEVAVAAAKGDI